jgi:hypothetical protein
MERRTFRASIFGQQRGLSRQPLQAKEMRDPAKQMIRRDHLFQVKLVEKTALTVLVPTHHPDHPHLQPQTSESGAGLVCKNSFSTIFVGEPTFAVVQS